MFELKIENELENIIYDIELRLGISPATRGYQCIKCGIAACLNDSGLTVNFKKLLYPLIAESMNMTVAAVERDIRTAISKGWWRHDEELSVNIFKNLLQCENDTPSNTMFIITVTEWIRLNYPDLIK